MIDKFGHVFLFAIGLLLLFAAVRMAAIATRPYIEDVSPDLAEVVDFIVI